MTVERVLNDEMYAWKADARRYLEGESMVTGDWSLTFASRVAWLIDEMARQVTEVERLRKLADYLRNGEVDVDEQEREYAHLRCIEEAAGELAAINLQESWRLDGQAAESYVAAVFPRWAALRAALARPPHQEKVMPYGEQGWNDSGANQ